MSLRSELKPRLKRLAYQSRALDVYHRVRNRENLTVVMFHRVVAPSDERWATCDPEYTVSDALFARCLVFFREHYNVIGLQQLLDARAGKGALPERPLLITFDDGWADNEEFCVRHLRAAGVPAVMFVVSDVVDRAEPFFQEQLVAAWRAGAITARDCAALWAAADGDPAREPRWTDDRDALGPLRRLIALLENLPAEERAVLLQPHAGAMKAARPLMITSRQLDSLVDGGFAIGSHGRTHTPLPRSADPAAELADSRAALGERLGAPPATISFPHGRYDDHIVRLARHAGYELMFTSDPVLNPVAHGVPPLLGRIGFTTETITDEHGNFSPELLALKLFRGPQRELSV